MVSYKKSLHINFKFIYTALGHTNVEHTHTFAGLPLLTDLSEVLRSITYDLKEKYQNSKIIYIMSQQYKKTDI